MSKIITLKDKITQEPIYPITSISAILNTDGNSIEDIINNKSDELDSDLNEINYRIQAAEDSIQSLGNLGNTETAQEELNRLTEIINSGKNDINSLRGDYSALLESSKDLIKKTDLVTNISGENQKIPTSAAVDNYIKEKSDEVLSYLISTTTVVPNYKPKDSGQILINTDSNMIYFSAGTNSWFSIEATPIILEEGYVEGEIIDDYLDLEGDIYVDGTELVINSGANVDGSSLDILGTGVSGDVNEEGSLSSEGESDVIGTTWTFRKNNTNTVIGTKLIL